jgi:putative peptide zinc metalloprotease protein
MQESAFVNPPWLLEREGSGYVQLTELLYRIAEHADGTNTVEEIAQKISDAGKPVNPATIRTLIAQLLIPRGLVEMADGTAVPVASGPTSPLALNMRMKMFGPDAITPITNILRVLYWPPVMALILATAVVVEVWIYAIHGIGASLHDAIYTPGFMAVVLVMIVVSAAFHELGHAAALHYAGGRIKGMGAGIYVVYPAFFTDVSDNYRLPRWQRVRTDLGGFYFNLIFALAIMGVYLFTGQEWLLLMVLLINLEIVHQLLPFLRLDGYWTLADITGVPDFFSQMTAFVRSVLPLKSSQGRKLPAMKTWAKVVFAVYMLITVPLLVFLLVLMVRSVPRVLATAWDSLGQQGQTFMAAQSSGNFLGLAGSSLQAVLLLIPTIGLCYTLITLGRRLVTGVWHWGQPSLPRRAASIVSLAAAAGLVGFMWIPQVSLPTSQQPVAAGPISPVSWQPIGAEDRGVVQDIVAANPTTAPTGVVSPTPRATTVAPVTDVQSHGTPQPTAESTAAAPTPVEQTAATAVPAQARATPPPAVRATATPVPVVRATATRTLATPTPIGP